MSNDFINTYIEPDGKFKYCYVVIVVNNIAYANPSIVFADSIRKVGSLCDLVIMIDEHIDKETEDLLKFFYDKIIKIKNIKINLLGDDKNKNVILTKIHSFGLIEYEKVFLVDVDTILYSNVDNILIKLDTSYNNIYKLKKDNTGFLVFKPSVKLYKKAIEYINKYKKNLEKVTKPFDYLLNKIFDKVEYLDKKINIQINKYDVDSDGIQYTIDKPFLMTSNLSIDERMRLDYFKVWFSYFMNIVNKYNKIKLYKCVEGSLEVSKYFLASLSRFIINFIKTNKGKKENIINDIFGIKKCKNSIYYHIDVSKEYNSESINYNSNVYGKKNFLIYLNNLKETKGKFTKYIELTDTIQIINNIKKDNNELLLFFLNKYIKIFPNVFVSLEIDKIDKIDNKTTYSYSDYNSIETTKLKSKSTIYVKELKNNLVYSTHIILKKNILENILLNLFETYTYTQRIKFFDSLDKINVVKLSVFETISPILSPDTNIECKAFVFYETISKVRISSIFFNANSLNYFDSSGYLNNIVIKNNVKIMDRKTLIKMLYLQSLKKWIYSIYSSDELENIIVLKYHKNIFNILDNNLHSMEKIKKILESKLNFLDIIFSQSPLYDNVIKKEKINTNDLYLQESYWELDGIKFLNKN